MMRRPSLVALVVTILLVLLAPATAFASGWEAPATLKGGSGEALGTAVAAGWVLHVADCFFDLSGSVDTGEHDALRAGIEQASDVAIS